MNDATTIPLLTDPTPELEIFRLTATADGTEIAEAIKARCVSVVTKHENIVKDRIIEIAKTKGYDISRGDISNIKVDKIKGGYDDWGTKLVDIQSIDNEPVTDKSIVFDDSDSNHGTQTTNFHFGYTKDIERKTSWTFSIGVKVKGGVAAFKGYEIDFGVEHAVINTDTDHVTWSKDIPVPPKTKVTAFAVLQIGHGSSTVTGIFEITKGDATISCDIRKYGTHHRSQDVSLTDILYKPELRRFISQGVFESDLSVKGVTSNYEEPLE